VEPQSTKNVTFERHLTKIGQYGYQNMVFQMRFKICTTHWCLMSHDCTIFRNYLCTKMASKHQYRIQWIEITGRKSDTFNVSK